MKLCNKTQQHRTIPNNMRNIPILQETETVLENVPSIQTTTEDSSTGSDISDQEYLEALNLAGTIPKTMVGNRTAGTLQTRHQDSGHVSDSSLHFTCPFI